MDDLSVANLKIFKQLRIGGLVFGILVLLANGSGCSLFPDVRNQPRYHNPFPQIETIAIMPFRNQSEEATLNMERVTLSYYDAVQSLPGFEVLPIGLVESQLLAFEQQVLQRPISSTEDLQRFASQLGVDAVLQGSVTDYDSYYPPRMTMKVNWYAANPGFHTIPPGYGLPWGTKAEKNIPQEIRLEAERALAREQIATQTPAVETLHYGNATPKEIPRPATMEREYFDPLADPLTDPLTDPLVDPLADPLEEGESIPRPRTATRKSNPKKRVETNESTVKLASHQETLPALNETELGLEVFNSGDLSQNWSGELPPRWPDPQGFIPSPPKSIRPVASSQSEPIITHMRSYNGSDGDFTQALSDYYYFRDDGRFGGWEAYLQRSEDFIRFCCHQHMIETIAARGGQLKSRTVVRWPLDRYER